jgi:nucleoid DNA-binding protein
MENMETTLKKDMADMKTDMEEKLETVNNEMRGLKTVLIEGFDEMDKIEENPRKVRNTASGDEETINGGVVTDCVEMFNWCQS